MVTATPEQENKTPNLIPVPPSWLDDQNKKGPSTNRNINDIYWAKGPNDTAVGWIIVGPSALPDRDGRPMTRQAERYIRKGRTPLIEYSYTDRISPLTGHRETIETNADRLGTPDRFYWFFQNGGAHLFPIEQIIAHHWHINPPYGLSVDVFPQLKEWEVPEPFYCGACAGEQPPRNSREEVVSHLLITHRMTLAEANDLIRSYDIHQPPRGRRGLTLRRKAQAIEKAAPEPTVEVSPDQPAPTLFICDNCGRQCKSQAGKMAHERSGICRTSQPADATNGQVEE